MSPSQFNKYNSHFELSVNIVDRFGKIIPR